jgi:4,5-DOPA dioxygenase extradiol
MNRRDFLSTISIMLTSAQQLLNEVKAMPPTPLMPAFFIGHGSPMNAILDNQFTHDLAKSTRNLPTPNAIMVVSAHWLTKGTFISVNKFPKPIYDFGGFPKALSEVKYEPLGSPEYALQTKILLDQSHAIQTDDHMGLDHGAWSILRHMYPKANIPVFQLSIDVTQPAKYHYNLIKQLAALRKRGLMIIGSGNIVHNLGLINWNNPNDGPYDWTVEFDAYVERNLQTANHLALVDYFKAGQCANLSAPTNEHYLPMLYVLGIQQKNEQLKFIHHSFDMGSISMRSFMLQG